jgi:hypothetical protein
MAGIMVAAVAAVATVSGSSVAGADDGPSRSDIESASTAIPAAPGANIHDESTRYRRTGAHIVRADSVASATSNCDGCFASAKTLQIVYAQNARTFTANNVATAWSTCTNCHSEAMSVQVVIARRAGIVTAGNRSLSFNAACVGCQTKAAAIQIVLVVPSHREPSQTALVRSEELRDQLAAQLHAQLGPPTGVAQPANPNGQAGPTSPPVPPEMAKLTEQIESLLAHDLRASSARHDIKLHTD